MSNDDDFVDIEEIDDNNLQKEKEENKNQNENENIEFYIENTNEDISSKNKNSNDLYINKEENINKKENGIENENIDNSPNNEFIYNSEEEINPLNNKENNDKDIKDENIQNGNEFNNEVENEIQNDFNDNNNIREQIKQTTQIKKKNSPQNFDASIHVHNPVPLSKLQLAENKYYKIRAELNKKYFNNPNEQQNEIDENLEAKKNKEMISYLEQLNDVLTEILKSSKVQQKEKEKMKKKVVQKSPEQIHQEQLKMNDNQEKLIEVYKKQLSSLQNRVNQVSQPGFLEDLMEKNKKLDEEIENIRTLNRKLNNEQKLNEIVISKQNKNEQEDKANMILKRMNMDFNKITRENEKLMKKIQEYKTKEEENENKIKQLQEFVDKLHTIAKDMYNITDYENVKIEEKNEKKREEAKNQYKKRIEILKKKKESNNNKSKKNLYITERIIRIRKRTPKGRRRKRPKIRYCKKKRK